MESRQPPFLSPQCSTGSPEAERLFQLGVDYHLGRKGLPYDPEKAEKCYEDAMHMGNAKAAMNLALLYRKDYGQLPHRWERLRYSVALLENAVDMGCPDAMFSLAEYYNWGWGVKEDVKKAEELVDLAAEKGSPQAIMQYAEKLDEQNQEDQAIALLEKSLADGNGNAGIKLSIFYRVRGDASNLVRTSRQGAALGSLNCLHYLMYVYNGDGQTRDEDYAKKIKTLLHSIDDREAPKPIKDFDLILPPKPIGPLTSRNKIVED